MRKFKNFYFVALAAIAMVFTSCSEDETAKPPTVNFKGGSAFVSSDVTLNTGEEFVIGVIATPNTESGAKLTSLTVTRTYNNIPQTAIDTVLDKLTSLDADIHFTALNVEGEERITFEITDKDGEVAEKSVVITTETSTTPLNDAQGFAWTRVGGNDATGLTEFGLAWTSNTSSVAIIKKGADKLVELSSTDWAGVTTQEALIEAVETGTGIDDFRGVSVTEASKTYDIVLGTQKGDKYFLIHITKSAVTAATAGTTVVITGDYKD